MKRVFLSLLCLIMLFSGCSSIEDSHKEPKKTDKTEQTEKTDKKDYGVTKDKFTVKDSMGNNVTLFIFTNHTDRDYEIASEYAQPDTYGSKRGGTMLPAKTKCGFIYKGDIEDKDVKISKDKVELPEKYRQLQNVTFKSTIRKNAMNSTSVTMINNSNTDIKIPLTAYTVGYKNGVPVSITDESMTLPTGLVMKGEDPNDYVQEVKAGESQMLGTQSVRVLEGDYDTIETVIRVYPPDWTTRNTRQ